MNDSTNFIGTYQIRPHWVERLYSHNTREIGDRNMARNLVPGISDVEACAKSGRYHSGGEDGVVTVLKYG